MSLRLIVLCACVVMYIRPGEAHGRLWEPPGRSTMWRRGFSTPVNYNDNELFCGGLQRHRSNGYRCGVCGDPYDAARPHEAGGRYATGTISRYYLQGEEINLQVDLTANHQGYFEFKICPVTHRDSNVEVTQACLDLHPLQLANGRGSRYNVTSAMGTNMINVRAHLPSGLVCDRCVLQWRYHAGNNWGIDPVTGDGCAGCGPQEEFYGCADVQILATGAPRTRYQSITITYQTAQPSTSGAPRPRPTATWRRFTDTYRERNWNRGGNGRTDNSYGNGRNSNNNGNWRNGNNNSNGRNENRNGRTCRGVTSVYDQWCVNNCAAGYCPESHCACVDSRVRYVAPRSFQCRATDAYSNRTGFHDWCRNNCAAGNCPSAICWASSDCSGCRARCEIDITVDSCCR